MVYIPIETLVVKRVPDVCTRVAFTTVTEETCIEHAPMTNMMQAKKHLLLTL